MKLREDTPERLVLEDRPVAMGVILGGMVLLCAGAAVMQVPHDLLFALGLLGGAAFWGLLLAVFVRRTLVILDAPSGLVVRRVAAVTGRTEETWPLAAVRGAAVESQRQVQSGRKASTTHRCALVLADPPGARVPLTEAYSGGTGAARAAEAVNGWLARHQG